MKKQNDIDELFKSALEEREFTIEPQFLEQLNDQLDQLPSKKGGNKFFYFVGVLSFILMILSSANFDDSGLNFNENLLSSEDQAGMNSQTEVNEPDQPESSDGRKHTSAGSLRQALHIAAESSGDDLSAIELEQENQEVQSVTNNYEKSVRSGVDGKSDQRNLQDSNPVKSNRSKKVKKEKAKDGNKEITVSDDRKLESKYNSHLEQSVSDGNKALTVQTGDSKIESKMKNSNATSTKEITGNSSNHGLESEGGNENENTISDQLNSESNESGLASNGNDAVDFTAVNSVAESNTEFASQSTESSAEQKGNGEFADSAEVHKKVVEDGNLTTEETKPEDEKPVDEKPSKWSIQISAGANYVSKSIQSDIVDYSQKRKDEEENIITPQFDLGINYALNNWRISTGINYTQFGENVNYTPVVYDSTFISSYDMYVDTASSDTTYTPVYSTVSVSNSGATAANGKNRHSYLTIPISFGYKFNTANNKFSITPKIGFGMRFLIAGNGQYISDDLIGVIERKDKLFSLSYYGSIEFAWHFNQVGVFIAPNFNSTFGSLSSLHRYYSVGGSIGFVYQLK